MSTHHARERALTATAALYHAWFTGLILLVARKEGEASAGAWIKRTFRRHHHARFLSSFDKLGLSGLPHAVACARYHCIANRIGGVDVLYHEEGERKAWVHFTHPRWIYGGTALCGVPVSVSRGYIEGWYAHNAVSLNNPRLAFVCTSQDMPDPDNATATYGFTGYFIEHGHDLAPTERLQYRGDETPPRFDRAALPPLDEKVWTPARLHKARRNYAMDYMASGLPELAAVAGDARALDLATEAAGLIGRQYYRELRETLGLDPADNSAEDFTLFMSQLLAGEDGTWRGTEAGWQPGAPLAPALHQPRWESMLAETGSTPLAPAAQALFEGCAVVGNPLPA